MRGRLKAAAITVALGMASVAQAHEFVCEKKNNGVSIFTIDKYPARIHYDFTVTNTHPYDASTALTVEDALLAPYGFVFKPVPPFTLPVGQSVKTSFDLTIRDKAQCAVLDAADGTTDGNIDNTLVITHDAGVNTCSSRVVCKGFEPPPACLPAAGATRGLGFFKTHPDAVLACLAAGPVNLGVLTVRTLAEFEGIFWGSPARFDNGEKRNTLDQARFLLMRETLVAQCNVRVFGARPIRPTLFTEAANTIAGTDCGAIRSFVTKVRGFNECNGKKPHGSWGPARPRDAQAVANDPTVSSGQSCK
jgi:hypothetical protein